MPLFSLRIDFEDRTYAIEQVNADTPEDALKLACSQAEALEEYDQQILAEMLERRVRFTHIAGLRGVWEWHQIPNASGFTADVFGGTIIQTDIDAPMRSCD